MTGRCAAKRPFLGGMDDIAPTRLPRRRRVGEGAATPFGVQEGRRHMINGFTLHETTTAPAASAEILNGVQKAWGFVPNLHRVLAESPAALEAYSTLWGIAEKTSFTPQERNIVYLAIIYETSAPIAWPATPICRGWQRSTTRRS